MASERLYAFLTHSSSLSRAEGTPVDNETWHLEKNATQIIAARISWRLTRAVLPQDLGEGFVRDLAGELLLEPRG